MYSAIVFLPLVAALVAGLGGRVIGDRGAQVVTCGAMILSSILGVVAFWEVAIGGQLSTIEVLTWVVSGSFEAHWRSEEHTSELQSLMRISYAVFCLTRKQHAPIIK